MFHCVYNVMDTFNKWLEANVNPQVVAPQMSDTEHDELMERKFQEVAQTLSSLKNTLQFIQEDRYDNTGYRDETAKAVQGCMRVLERYYQSLVQLRKIYSKTKLLRL